jgi:hypothetical protein
MHRLDATGERRVGRFVVETAAIEFDDEPFPAPFLAALRRLVPCDDVSFSELDRVAERDLGFRCYPVWDGPEPEVSYWEIRHEHPVCHWHEVTGDFSAHRLTDFLTARQLRRSRIHADWLRPQHVRHQLTVRRSSSSRARAEATSASATAPSWTPCGPTSAPATRCGRRRAGSTRSPPPDPRG